MAALKRAPLSDTFKNLDQLGAAQLFALAQKAEASERFEDMCEFIKAFVLHADTKELTVQERNQLSVAYKNVIGTRRTAWRSLNEQIAEQKGSPFAKALQTYKEMIETELKAICDDVLGLLQKTLLPRVAGKKDDSEVFYLKMTADYYRYLVEFLNNQEYKQKAKENYEAAYKIAQETLATTHPIRLGLALNFSVCYYEILGDRKSACELAKTAFDAAIAGLDKLPEEAYKDSTLIMQLLRDNLTLWTSDQARDETAGDGTTVTEMN